MNMPVPSPRRSLSRIRESPCAALRHDTRGGSLIELALITPLLLLILIGSVDLGRAFYAANEVAAAAAAGAAYGVQNPTDINGMQQAAMRDAADLNSMTTAASFGCECPDGSSASPSCASTPACNGTAPVRYVAVTTASTFTPTLRFPGLPSSYALHGSARMRTGQ